MYALNLVNENYNDSNNFYHHYQIVETGSPEEKIEGLEFVFVELQKFEAKNISEKKLQVLWLRFLTEIDEKTTEVPQDLLETAEIKEATEKLEANSFTKAQLEYYDKYWDKVRRERTLKEESFDKGRIEGRVEGRTEGEQIGIAKGEQIKSYKTALIAPREKMPSKIITKLTDLSPDVITKLKELIDKYGENAEQYLNEL